MSFKSEYLKNNLIPLLFSIIGIEIILCCYYSEFNLVWFVLRGLLGIFYIEIFKKIDESKEKRVIKYIIIGGIVLSTSFISIKILSENSGSIFNIISSGSLLDKKFQLPVSIILCFILSYVLYILIFKFIRAEVVFILFIFLITLYLKSSCINSIFIYVFILSFFSLLCINIGNKLNRSIIIIVSMFILALLIPVPKELPQLSMFKGIKDIINPQKYKLTLDGGSTPTYVSREESSDKVLYTFTGDNPTYFISEAYDNIANNSWNKVDTALFNGKNLDEDDSFKESVNTRLKTWIDLLDNNYSEEVNEIKNARDENPEEGTIEIIDKDKDITDSEYSYIHPSKPKEYTFFYKKESYYINGFNRIYGNELGEDGASTKANRVHIDTSENNEESKNKYIMAYNSETPQYRSKDYYIMKYMSEEKYLAIRDYLRKEISNDKEYMESLKTKESLEKLFRSFYGDTLNNTEYVIAYGLNVEDNIYKMIYLDNGKLKYKLYKDENGGVYNEEQVIYDSGDNSEDKDYEEIYSKFLETNINGTELDAYYTILMSDYYGIETKKWLFSDNEYEDYYTDDSKSTVRMNTLALSLTEGEDSTYSKAKAIENYFSNGDFKYSFNVSRTNSKDPIDYFIFEGKKGYCIQYATAMVLLCRSVNIPARYVEGYYVTERDKVGDTYEIKENNAHAFVQVYIRGYGWKIFDPTPGFYSGEDETENVTVLSNNRDFSDILMYGILTIIIVSVCIYIYFKLNYRKRKIKRILKGSNEETLEKLISYSIELLKYCNITYEEGETEMEFAIRVDKLLNINFKECMNKYYKYKYGSYHVIDEDIMYVLKVNNEIYMYKKEMKKRLSKIG